MLNPLERNAPERLLSHFVRRGLRQVWYGMRRLGVTLPKSVFLRSEIEESAAAQLVRPRDRKVLAIVDFATFPLSFDVLNLMAFAELYRRHVGADAVDLAFLADRSAPVHTHVQADRSGVRTDHMTFVHNLCLEGARLLPRPGSILFFSDRQDFARYLRGQPRSTKVLPRGYSARGPSYISGRGEPPLYGLRSLLKGGYTAQDEPLLQPGKEQQTQIQRWLSGHVTDGATIVVVTIRNCGKGTQRNSALEEWKKLIDSYRADESVRFVVVPDYFEVFLPTGLEAPNVSVCHEAALLLGLRAALYSAADLNLFVGNGPATVAYIDHRMPFLTFKMSTNERSSRLEEIAFQHALAPGEALPWFSEDRAIVWEEDRFEVMRPAVDAFFERREPGDGHIRKRDDQTG